MKIIETVTANVARRLTLTAQRDPEGLAVAEPRGRAADGSRIYRQLTFRQLDQDTDRIAQALASRGARPGMRLVLMVRPGIDFIALVFGMLKAGVVVVLIDPGMGRRNMIRCLREVEPEGFVAIPLAHAIRVLLRRRFPKAEFNVTVGRRWFWGGPTLRQLRGQAVGEPPRVATTEDDPAAIIFTTGSTGPPKGVLYLHRNFNRQVDAIRDRYGIQPGEVDLPCFPLFALFNCAMGVATVIPEMDFTRPARVNPERILEAVRDWKVTQSFGSPALLNVLGRHCERNGIHLSTLKRVLSAGAPVPAHVLRRMKAAMDPEGEIHTPYGATEALPVASISGSQVLEETQSLTEQGRGVCVGNRFPGIQWKVIQIEDGPLKNIEQVREALPGQIGELMVRGDVVTRDYVTRTDANAAHKVEDLDGFWHRMGDVGYLDQQDRFWFCGRKSHRVQTTDGPMFTIPCESIINQHPRVYRSALVGLGTSPRQRPVIIAETWPDARPSSDGEREQLRAELLELAASHPLTSAIRDVLLHPSLPVDIRHNAKIFREKLAVWARKFLQVGAY